MQVKCKIVIIDNRLNLNVKNMNRWPNAAITCSKYQIIFFTVPLTSLSHSIPIFQSFPSIPIIFPAVFLSAIPKHAGWFPPIPNPTTRLQTPPPLPPLFSPNTPHSHLDRRIHPPRRLAKNRRRSPLNLSPPPLVPSFSAYSEAPASYVLPQRFRSCRRRRHLEY